MSNGEQMKTSEAIRKNFPIGARVETRVNFVRRGEKVRCGTVKGYCADGEDFVRVRWDGYKSERSTVPVDVATLIVVTS